MHNLFPTVYFLALCPVDFFILFLFLRKILIAQWFFARNRVFSLLLTMGIRAMIQIREQISLHGANIPEDGKMV